MNPSQNAGTRCRLLELPIGIRDKIYEHTQREMLLESPLLKQWLDRAYGGPPDSAPHFATIQIVRAPHGILMSTCSTIRDEHWKFCNQIPTVQFRFIWHLKSAGAVQTFQPLSHYLQDIGHAGIRLESEFRKLEKISLQFHFEAKQRPYYQLRHIENFLNCFPNLQMLEINATCDQQWYSTRGFTRPPAPFWTFVDRDQTLETRFPDLVVKKNLVISTETATHVPVFKSLFQICRSESLSTFFERGVEDEEDEEYQEDEEYKDDDDNVVNPPRTYFKATEGDWPEGYAWQGLNLEQVDPNHYPGMAHFPEPSYDIRL